MPLFQLNFGEEKNCAAIGAHKHTGRPGDAQRQAQRQAHTIKTNAHDNWTHTKAAFNDQASTLGELVASYWQVLLTKYLLTSTKESLVRTHKISTH